MTNARPSPIPSPQTEAFWDAAGKHQFMVPSCDDCGRAHWYPRPFCPHCYSTNVELKPAQGSATLHSFTVLGKDEKQIVAYAELAEGPILLTNIIDTDPDTLKIGDPLEVTFDISADGTPVPVFKGVSR